MIVLSLFDGMSCGYEALKRAGIYVEKYYASEIDKHAITIAKKNHPDIIHIGDVRNWQNWNIEKPDLIIGGSPCQGFSFAGGQLAFDDPRSKLFFEMTDIIDYFKPRFKLLENVKMKKEFLDVITDFINCGEPHFINSALVSAQNRQRFYWYNWEAPDPEDRKILLRDIIEEGTAFIKDHGEYKLRNHKSMCIDANYYKGADNHGQRTLVGISHTKNGIRPYKNDGRKGSFSEIGTIATPDNKVSTLTVANVPKITGARVVDRRLNENGKRDNIYDLRDKSNTILSTIHKENIKSMVKRKKFGLMISTGGRIVDRRVDPKNGNGLTYRKLTITECERLQTLPDGYTEGVSNTQRYRMLGNGWTVDVIAHLFSYLPLNEFERMMKL